MKPSGYCTALLGLLLAGGVGAEFGQTGTVAGKEPGSAIRQRPLEQTQPAAPTTSVVISLYSGGELLLADSLGRRSGFNPDRGRSWKEIPHATYADESIQDPNDDSGDPASTDEKTLDIRPPQPGLYTLTVYGTRNGAYDLEFRSANGFSSRPPTVLKAVPASVGSRQSYSFTIPPGGGPIEVAGAFAASPQGTGSVRLLTYASPLAGVSALPAGTTTFPMVIFYGAQAIPSSFSATMDGSPITASFHPLPGRFEVVRLRLHPGRNVLELGIAGAAEGRMKDELVFSVGP